MSVDPSIFEPPLMRFMPYLIFIPVIIYSIIVIYEIRDWRRKRRLRKILNKIKEI